MERALVAMPVRVLIIDDSIIDRDVLRHYIECIGCAVVAEAENTVQALHLFRTVSPSLVTLDFAVAQAGGISALALFRIMRTEQPSVRILVSSALAAPEIRETFLAGGAADYIAKPFDSENFERVCARLIELFPGLLAFNRSVAYRPTKASRRL
jgi:CheY-like chemotaxis protein